MSHSIANLMESKTPNQVKHFYQANRGKLNLVPPSLERKAEEEEVEVPGAVGATAAAATEGPATGKKKKTLAVSLTAPPPSAAEKETAGRVCDFPCVFFIPSGLQEVISSFFLSTSDSLGHLLHVFSLC
jgi:hypothetical protein